MTAPDLMAALRASLERARAHVGQVASPMVCATCDGDTTVVVEQRGVDVQVPCPGCACAECGERTDTPPQCGTCFCREDAAARRRADV